MAGTLHFIIIFVVAIGLGGCGSKQQNYSLDQKRTVAVLSVSSKVADLVDYEKKELDRVVRWMDRDLIERLRKKKFKTSYLKEMKDYSKTMGDLFIINVEFFNGGRKNRPSKAPDTGPSTLELKYTLLDARGALVAEWRDGADSRRGGTYCARLLNKKAVKRLNSLYR